MTLSSRSAAISPAITAPRTQPHVRLPAGFLALFVLWELAAQAYGNPVFLPPSVVLPRFIGLLLSGALLRHVGTSLVHVLCGFSVAVAFGFSLGVVVSLSPRLYRAVMPVADAIRGVSALSIFPLILLMLGLGLESKAFVIFWTAWPAVLLNTASGLAQVDRDLVEAASLDTSSRWTIARHIRLPLALPTILTGMRIAVGGGWISLTAAEMLGGNGGLGFFILQSSQTFRFAEMYAGILTVACVGYLMNAALWRLQQIYQEE